MKEGVDLMLQNTHSTPSQFKNIEIPLPHGKFTPQAIAHYFSLLKLRIKWFRM
jgi:hypothetical protein